MSTSPTIVWLVGAGPGDPDLLTVRATRVLRRPMSYCTTASSTAACSRSPGRTRRVVDVGKRLGGWKQEQINELLVLYALAGHRVVRLKGGDPFVFGRGREEADALDAAGVAWEVVPGLSSALAAPALVGIPVTHRALAASFTVVTASRADGEPEPDWNTLARLGGTLVVLMGRVAVRTSPGGWLRAASIPRRRSRR